MTQLSPQAQKVVDAFYKEWEGWCGDDVINAIAAVLHALAKQSTFADTKVGVTEEVVLVDDILKIATELDNI
jgi:hypothetical protein